MRYEGETPSQGGRSFGVREFDVVIHDEMREHHLCHDGDVEPAGAGSYRTVCQHHRISENMALRGRTDHGLAVVPQKGKSKLGVENWVLRV